jgi:membrane protein DedA with SNARE-associated domain
VLLPLFLQVTRHVLHTQTAEGRLWAYVVLGATSIVTEEVAPLIGGLASRSHELRFLPVALWISAGTWSADVLLYYLGRWRGDWVRERFPNARAFLVRALRLVRRHPWRSSVAVRFAYGLRFTLPIACGAARVPLWLYLIGSATSAVIWSFLFTLLGWGAGEAALRTIGHLRRYERWIMLGIVVLVVLVLYIAKRRRVADEVVDVLATGDEERPLHQGE